MANISTITINNSTPIIPFTIYGTIQENDINNVLFEYNKNNSTSYTIINITDVYIGNSVCEIGIKAFKNFTSLDSITFADSVITINDKAFYNCTSLVNITMNPTSNLKIIGYKAFYNCTSLEEINIYNNLTNIGDYAFAYCSLLQSITINDTSNLICIGKNLFLNINGNGTYNFGSHNNFKTVVIEDLISQLPPAWTGNNYITFVDFAVIYDNNIPSCLNNNTSYVDLSSVEISWKDFHNIFFYNNSYFSLNRNIAYQPNLIIPSDLAKYTILNNQVDVYDNSFNLLETIENIYEEKIPRNLWSVESALCFYKNIAQLKSIFNFQVDRQKLICKKNNPILYNNICQPNCINSKPLEKECKKNSKKHKEEPIIKTNTISQCDLIYNKCNYKTSYVKGCSLINIDEFFNLFEAQGVAIANKNEYYTPTLEAKGLPADGATTKYAAILNIFLKSCNKCVNNLNIRFPYLIDFSGSMPTSTNDNNNYRYNP